MNFKTYQEMMTSILQTKLGDHYHVYAQKITKNNGVERTGLIARSEDMNSYPTVYIEEYYHEGITKKEISEIAQSLSQSIQQSQLKETVDMSFFLEYEQAKSNIVYKLINTEQNKALLQDVPHRMFCNLSIVYYYLAKESPFHGSASILIRNTHMDSWEVSEKQLYETASLNTPKLLPADIESMEEMLRELFDGEISQNEIPMHVVTNKDKCMGAVCVLYPEVLSDFAGRMNSNLYVLPSSIHEMILIPDRYGMSVENLLSMVTEINHTQVAAEEVLADSVYYYDKMEDELYLLDN